MYYEKAHVETFGKNIWIRPGYYGRFNVLQRQLNKDEISAREYGYDVVRYLYGWAKTKGLDHVPIPTYCGPFAMKVYKRIQGQNFVRIPSANDDYQAMVLHGELLLARYYVSVMALNKEKLSFYDVYKRLRALIPGEWVTAAREHKRPITEVARIVAEEHLVSPLGIYGYRDLIEALA